MGDLAKGIKGFKKEMAEGEDEPDEEPKAIEHKPAPAAARKTKQAAAKSPRKRKSS
jgi:Sec-independent protein translocase protein TatA